jgi:hypothetical protein
MNKDTPVEPRKSEQNKSKALPAGSPAPDFSLKSTPDQAVSLRDFRGRP